MFACELTGRFSWLFNGLYMNWKRMGDKLIKRICALFLASSLLISAAGCSAGRKRDSSSTAVSSQNETSISSEEDGVPEEGSPAAAVIGLMDAFENLKTEELQKAVAKAVVIDNPEMLQVIAENSEGLLKNMTKNMSYQLDEASVTGDTAVVPAVITNTDFSGVTKQLLPALVGIAVSNPNASQEEMSGLILNELSHLMEQAGGEPVSAEVDIQLKRADGEWEVQASTELLNAISGGLLGSFLEMADQLGSLAG